MYILHNFRYNLNRKTKTCFVDFLTKQKFLQDVLYVSICKTHGGQWRKFCAVVVAITFALTNFSAYAAWDGVTEEAGVKTTTSPLNFNSAVEVMKTFEFSKIKIDTFLTKCKGTFKDLFKIQECPFSYGYGV